MKSKKRTVALNMAAAAKALAVTITEIKRAKRAGSTAFLRSGRIDLGRLRRWFAKYPAASNIAAVPSVPVDLVSLEASLAAAVSVEESNLKLLRAAQARGDALAAESLTAAYSRSQKNRLATEKDVRQQKLEAGQLLTLHEHKIQLHRLWTPVVTTVRQIPRKAAMQLGGDDVRVEKVVAEIVEAALADCRKTINPQPEDAHFCFTLWLALILSEDPTGEEAVTKIRAALAEVEAAIAETAKAQKSPGIEQAPNEG
jgi:hypothetical protein